jgi:hypothetical protein
VICPACGAAPLDGDRFCRRCGRPLAGDVPPAPPGLAAGHLPPPGLPPHVASASSPPAGGPAGSDSPASPSPPQTFPSAAGLFELPPSPPLPPRRPGRFSGSTLALLFIGLVLFLAATNPSPAAYVAWAARRVVPGVAFRPLRDAAYLAVERATVAESYGVCTVFQTSLTTGTMTVLGIMGQFVPVGSSLPPAPQPEGQPRRRRRPVGGVQI